MKIIKKAYAKINLALDIKGIRTDGYHEVEMIMSQVSLCDELEICLNDAAGIRFKTDSDEIPAGSDNLVIKACNVFFDKLNAISEKKTKKIQNVDIFLRKRIPTAAGLAGGSSDAAAVISALNELAGEPFSLDDLCAIGAGVGSDIPFCIVGGTALAKGRGEVLEPVRSFSGLPVILVKPDIGISTQEAYALSDSCDSLKHPDVEAVRRCMNDGDLKGAAAKMGNSFEDLIKSRHPEVLRVIEELKKTDPVKVMMTGSGPTVFAIYEAGHDIDATLLDIKKKMPEKTFAKATRLL